MQIPVKIPGLKLFTILFVVYAAVWISLEGALWRVLLMGVGAAVLVLAYAWQKYLAGRTYTLGRWLAITAASGLLFGLACGVLTLIFMSIKTGLHAHGPEFTRQEIDWLIGQVTWWATAGLVGGVGLGMLISSFSNR